MGKKRKTDPHKGVAWPKPIAGAVEPPRTWFLDNEGDGAMPKRRRTSTTPEVDTTKRAGAKSRARLGIKGE